MGVAREAIQQIEIGLGNDDSAILWHGIHAMGSG